VNRQKISENQQYIPAIHCCRDCSLHIWWYSCRWLV